MRLPCKTYVMKTGGRAMEKFFKANAALFVLLMIVQGTDSRAEEMIKPIPTKIAVDARKAALGKQLFLDPRLSKDNTIACVSCHNIGYGGADSGAVSTGVGGKTGTVNSPTVFNAVFNFAQFWDGRAKDLKSQALGPIANPVEMASTYPGVVAKLSRDKQYHSMFQQLYPKQGLSMETISDAIAEFEKTLITPNARFDLYLRGKKDALTPKEKEGYGLFKSRGCIACHNGVNIGGNMYQRFGVFAQYKDRFNTPGRFSVTGKEEDRYFFKVPSLRNIEKTAPYFHDGSAKTLEDAVEKMAYYQLGRKLSKEDIEKITAFLHTLNGELPKSIQ